MPAAPKLEVSPTKPVTTSEIITLSSDDECEKENQPAVKLPVKAPSPNYEEKIDVSDPFLRNCVNLVRRLGGFYRVYKLSTTERVVYNNGNMCGYNAEIM